MMSVTHTRQKDTIIYTFTGHVDTHTAHCYFDLNYTDYHQIGDAIGVVMDIGNAKVRFSALNAANSRMRGVVFNTPVAFVGKPDTAFATFLSMLEAMSSKGSRRFSYFSNVDEAVAWIDNWFVERHLDRNALRGQVTATPTPPKQVLLN